MSSQTIHKARGMEREYAITPNSTSQDKNLSYEALGLLMYVLSLPENWKIHVNTLSRDNCKRDKVYRILGELLDAGYVSRFPTRDELGRSTGVEYLVYARPQDNPKPTPRPENPNTDNPDTDNPDTEKPTLQSKQINKEKNNNKENSIKNNPATPDGVGRSDDSSVVDEDDSSSALPNETGQEKRSAQDRRREQLQRNAVLSEANAGKVGVPDFHTKSNASPLKIADFGTDSLEAYIAEMLRTEFGQEVKNIARSYNEDLSKPIRISPTQETLSPRQLWQGTNHDLFKRYIATVVPRLIRERTKDKPETIYKQATIKTVVQMLTKYPYELAKFFKQNGKPSVIPSVDTPQKGQPNKSSWSDFATPLHSEATDIPAPTNKDLKAWNITGDALQGGNDGGSNPTL